MINAEAGDGIDLGKGQFGIIVEARPSGALVVSWDDGAHTTVVPDHRAHVDRGYFGRLVAATQAAETAARKEVRSQAAVRGWQTRRSAAGTKSDIPDDHSRQ